MNSRVPGYLAQYSDGKDAYNLVLGAMLGGYLGLTISRTGLSGGTYIDLGLLLFACCLFVLSLNNVGDRLHRENNRWAVFFGTLALGNALVAWVTASRIGVDGNILLTIFVVWVVVITMESLSAFMAIRSHKNKIKDTGS